MDPQELHNALLKRREMRVKVGERTFLARRFSDAQAADLDRLGLTTYVALAQQFVIGWEGVTVNDILGDGTMDAAPFSPGLWREWCADHPEVWEPIATKLLASYKEHEAARSAAAKN